MDNQMLPFGPERKNVSMESNDLDNSIWCSSSDPEMILKLLTSSGDISIDDSEGKEIVIADFATQLVTSDDKELIRITIMDGTGKVWTTCSEGVFHALKKIVYVTSKMNKPITGTKVKIKKDKTRKGYKVNTLETVSLPG